MEEGRRLGADPLKAHIQLQRQRPAVERSRFRETVLDPVIGGLRTHEAGREHQLTGSTQAVRRW